MLEHLHLKNVGPAPEMEMALAPRLNLITGDNGLGKSFLLDVAWWTLTGTWPRAWPGYGAVPDRRPGTSPSIRWREGRSDAGSFEVEAPFDFDSQTWSAKYPSERAATKPRLVVFARVDGGFSVWDPHRKGEAYRLPYGEAALGRSSAFQFSATDVWEGLTLSEEPPRRVCEGLWRDLTLWSLDPSTTAFELLGKVVDVLSSHERVTLTRERAPVVVDDTRESPILQTAGGPVLLVHASAALRRILSLAYVMVWAWREHTKAAEAHRAPATTELVVLIDEVESHLHPKWQRHIVPALLQVAGALAPTLKSQVLVTTHAPLVLASVEPVFDAARDAWFDLDLEGEPPRVHLRRRTFVRHGEVSDWLVSEAFDLRSARSLEAERVMEEAARALSNESFDREAARRIEGDLRKVLGETDPFWLRWRYVGEARGWLPKPGKARRAPKKRAPRA